MTQTQHTPGKWELDKEDSLIIEGCDGRLSIAEVHDHSDTSDIHTRNEAEANAEFIIQACNCHDELVAASKMALRALLDHSLEHCDVKEALCNAIKKARGEI